MESQVVVQDEKVWQVPTNRGDKIKAQFVIQAIGPANRPKLTGITGIQSFKGHTFHTSRWDYDCYSAALITG